MSSTLPSFTTKLFFRTLLLQYFLHAMTFWIVFSTTEMVEWYSLVLRCPSSLELLYQTHCNFKTERAQLHVRHTASTHTPPLRSLDLLEIWQRAWETYSKVVPYCLFLYSDYFQVTPQTLCHKRLRIKTISSNNFGLFLCVVHFHYKLLMEN